MPTLSERLDIILINLNTLSQLQVSDRPIFSAKIVTIQKYWNYITPIIRTLSGETRNTVIAGFNDLLTDIERIYNEYNENLFLYNGHDTSNSKQTALVYLLQLTKLKISIPKIYSTDGSGINAMIDTYQNFPEIVSQLKVCSDHFKEFYYKLDMKITEICKLHNIDNSEIKF